MHKTLSSASFSVIVGMRIRRAREKTGISQRELGLRTHLDNSTISRIEAGKCSVRLELVWAIAQALSSIDSNSLYNSLIEIKKLNAPDLAGILVKYPDLPCLVFVAAEQANLNIIDFVASENSVMLIAVPES